MLKNNFCDTAFASGECCVAYKFKELKPSITMPLSGTVK